MSEELKLEQCPKCKSTNIGYENLGEHLETYENSSYRYECKDCYYSPDWWEPNLQDAAAYWNMRPVETELRARVAELESKNRMLTDDLETCRKVYKKTQTENEWLVEKLRFVVNGKFEAQSKPEETTIFVPGHYENVGTFVICKRCRTVMPPEIAKFVWSFCPACGRKIERGNK